MKDAALLLNLKYKDQGVQTNISFDQFRGTFVSLDTPRANKYQYCQFVDPFTAHNKKLYTCYHVPVSQQNQCPQPAVTLDPTFLFKMASSSRDPYPEDSTTRVPDDEVLGGPANLQIVVVLRGYK